jgi:DNA modification methylase
VAKKVKRERQVSRETAGIHPGLLAPDVVDVDTLVLDPENARSHDARSVEAIAASAGRFQQRKPLIVRRSDRRVIAGNGFVAAARARGWKKVAVVWVDDDDATAKAFALADNRTAELSDWNRDVLREQLRALDPMDDLVTSLGWDEDELIDLTFKKGDVVDGGEVPEPPENPVSKPGEIYELGPHRLACGSSTDADLVAKLMGGEKARLMATDPPYLVDYDGNNHGMITRAHRMSASGGGTGGQKTWDEYNEASKTLFHDFIRVALPHLEDDAPIYQWHASRRQVLVEDAWAQNDLLVHQAIVWVKPSGVLTRSHMLWRYEPCFYGWKKGHQPAQDRRPPTTMTNVWEISKASIEESGLHPTMKPLEVCRWPIAWHLRADELCYEPFGGSGTCLISAAMEGRRCYTVELSPAFCDVIRRRYTKLANKNGLPKGSGCLE